MKYPFKIIVQIFMISQLQNYAAAYLDKEMTIKVKPGTMDCFYEKMNPGDRLEIEYQVINGEHGELDIDFYFYGRDGYLIKEDERESEASHRITITEVGDYKFCWDNSFSRISTKTVFFAVTIENEATTPYSQDPGIAPYTRAEEVYDMKVDDIKSALDRIKSYTTKSRFIQDAISASEARDRNVAENNYSKINTFSLISVVTMISTSLLQVVLVRSLFDERSKLHRLWRKKSPSLGY